MVRHWTTLKVYNLLTHSYVDRTDEYDALCDCKNDRNPILVLVPEDSKKGMQGFVDPQTDVDWTDFWDKGDEIISRYD